MSIGENIKHKREIANLTQKELAEKLGITQSMIAQLERGTKTLTVPLGKEMASVLECDINELVAD